MTTQVYAEALYRKVPDAEHRVLIVGGTSLAGAVAFEMARRGIPAVLVDDGSYESESVRAEVQHLGGSVHFVTESLSAQDLIAKSQQLLDGLTTVVNICLPNPHAGRQPILGYADELLARNIAAAECMSATGGGAIVNHCALPVMYAGGPFEDYVSSVRGAVTGVIRSIARKHGRQNIRSVGVQTGLLDLPEVHAWVSDAVKAVEVPVKRWGTATECAKLIAFMGLDASYITGQILILDGGLTAGLSGT